MANRAKTALLCAYTLARAKQYSEAEALLLSHEELSRTPEAIDLLARIRMEEGDVPEARRLWQGIQTNYPEHEPSRVALKMIGKPQMKVRWALILASVLPFVLVIGVLLGLFIQTDAVPQRVVVDWDRLPSQATLETLSVYRGKATRVCVASRFFADPEKVISRALLTEMMAQVLALPESAIFLGNAPSELGDEMIRVELECGE
jgi:hypothetical protein